MRTKILIVLSYITTTFLLYISFPIRNFALETTFKVEGKNIQIEFDENLYSRIIAKFGMEKIIMGDFSPSDFITVLGNNIKDFELKSYKKEDLEDIIGRGEQYIISGDSPSFSKEIIITFYDEFPSIAIFQVKYINISDYELKVERWTNHHYWIAVKSYDNDEPSFYSYQSGSYENRPDWVLPLEKGFKQENYMGMNATDYGGGTPITDIWRKDVGIGVGHVELVPKLVSLPVTMPDNEKATLRVNYEVNKILKPGESIKTFRTFVAVHRGDYFQTLTEYQKFMIKQGIKFKESPESTYEPIWCAWGYGRDFTFDQIRNTFPKVKDLGYKWVVLDDGWQTAEGDWYLNKEKFPKGEVDMKAFVDKIHAEGLKAKLWWAPLSVDPGTDLIKNHPDYLLINEDGNYQDISWWDAYYLCPAYPPVKEYTKNLVMKIMQDWGFDGLKVDGQHLNAAPPCYSKEHEHKYPEESFEQIPEFFKVIYEIALSIKPDAVVEICPCGTAYSFFTMPYFNQPVASDPESSWQIRLKGKTFKALMGTSVPYYGDHVELSDGRCDFASTVGIGGVIGTKFTWPVGAEEGSRIDLTPDKEKIWKKWMKIYQEKMLPSGTYLGTLYDIGFDKPEAHVIKKDSNLYYAFYANKWKGELELRGLDKRSYKITDYVNDKDYGTVKGPTSKLYVEFYKYLLIEAIPE
jgi:alpha-galactosidase